MKADAFFAPDYAGVVEAESAILAAISRDCSAELAPKF
jgi:hypothetical protein